ncbi:UNVERIFIED_CONTAM: hypothetical protein HDU68_012244 [Siphonaria sp. JEL0065]|nr:hypothetical protein HDU68_012244 [Siphonaria sp. JEL0065]
MSEDGGAKTPSSSDGSGSAASLVRDGATRDLDPQTEAARNRRIEQNRRAQQAHRQRRQEFLNGLHNQVQGLELMNRRAKETVAFLQNRLLSLERENTMLRQLVPARNLALYWDNMLTGFGNLNWQPPLSVPATAPMPLQLLQQPHVVLSNRMHLPRTVVDQSPITPLAFSPSIAASDDTKSRLRITVPNLGSCAAVDSYFEFIKTQETETNLESVKTNHIKTSQVWFDILDHCEIRDRPKVIQVMQPLIDMDHQHIVRIQEHISDFVGQQPAEHEHKETVIVDCFRNGISHIPSLRTLEASLAVEELCDGFLVSNTPSDQRN